MPAGHRCSATALGSNNTIQCLPNSGKCLCGFLIIRDDGIRNVSESLQLSVGLLVVASIVPRKNVSELHGWVSEVSRLYNRKRCENAMLAATNLKEIIFSVRTFWMSTTFSEIAARKRLEAASMAVLTAGAELHAASRIYSLTLKMVPLSLQ